MITVLTGDNDFEIVRETRKIENAYEGVAERIDGSNIQPSNLPDLVLGTTLFSDSRLTIIKNLSDNRSAWSALPEYAEKVPTEFHLILVEPKPDKRTKTYKALQKHATIKEFKLWGEREVSAAERWTAEEATRLGAKIDAAAARLVVRRALVVSEKGAAVDQWRIVSSLEKLAPFGSIRAAEVEAYIDETPMENVFSLLETALRGDAARVKEAVGRLETSDDPFRLFGLLSGQVFWLAVLATSHKGSSVAAKDFGAHPFILSKLDPYARALGEPGVKQIAAAFAEADTSMKTSAASPWLLIERALIKVARTAQK